MANIAPCKDPKMARVLLSVFSQMGPMHLELLDRPACPECRGFGSAMAKHGDNHPCAACGGSGWRK